MNFWSRYCEYEADEFAVNLGYAADLKGGLTNLMKENLSNMNPDWMYVAYHHSHPHLLERQHGHNRASPR